MKTKYYLLIIFAITLILVLAACSARRVGKEWKTSETENSEIKEGRLVYKMNCQRCHPNGEAGVGPPLNSFKFPGFLLRPRVRSRAFLLWAGRMPAFDKHEISKKELKSLIAFMHEMEKSDDKASNGTR